MPPELLGLAMFRPQQAAALLRRYPGELALAWEGGRPVGVLGYRLDGRTATMLHIAVEPAWRRRGVGRRLAAWLAGWADRVVAETDASAVAFYGRCGFSIEPAGERDGTPRYRAVLGRGVSSP